MGVSLQSILRQVHCLWLGVENLVICTEDFDWCHVWSFLCCVLRDKYIACGWELRTLLFVPNTLIGAKYQMISAKYLMINRN